MVERQTDPDPTGRPETAAPLGARELYEDLIYGFRIGTLPTSRRVDAIRFLPVSAPQTASTDSLENVAVLARMTSDCFDDSAALELTGGTDSRLVLALALAGGGRPRKSFTVAVGSSDDVRVAAEIAALLGIEHRTITPSPDPTTALRDAANFARESGWVCNCVGYGWLPDVYRQLADFRTTQVGGVGGEIASGFYRTALDPIWRHPPLLPFWKRLRLARPGFTASSLFRIADARRLERETAHGIGDFFKACTSVAGWQERTDDLYLKRRIGHWALPTLKASSYWYQPRMPFLSANYLAWARAVPAAERTRSRQVRLADQLITSALSPNDAAGLFVAPRRARGRKLGKIVHALERLASKPRESPPLFQEFAKALVRDERFRRGVLALADDRVCNLGLDPNGVRDAIARPHQFAFELGALGTAAFSHGLIDTTD